MKKWLSFLALAILPFASAQASTLPNVLAGLDNASNLEVMNDQQLSEVRGTGNLPSHLFAYREHYYTYNNYGNESDFRSYFYDGGSTYYGGKNFGSTTGAWAGDAWIVNTNSTPIEEHSYYIEPDGNGGYIALYQLSYSDWNRPWNGVIQYWH